MKSPAAGMRRSEPRLLPRPRAIPRESDSFGSRFWAARAARSSCCSFDPFGRLAGRISIDSIGVDGTKVTMAHPRLAGFRKDGRPYLVNAREAIQDAAHPTLVQLLWIDSEISLAEGGQAHLTANSGLYDSSKEHMDVKDDVRVKSPQYDVTLRSASIDFNAGRYSSNEAVTIMTSNGTKITGDSLAAVDNGKELTIEGHVKTMIPPTPAPDDSQSQTRSANR
jgi:lipopolysaccharide export system protein LptC